MFVCFFVCGESVGVVFVNVNGLFFVMCVCLFVFLFVVKVWGKQSSYCPL